MREKFCKHCELEILDPKLIDSYFCCNGCETAFEIIGANGFSNYYKLRQNDPKIRNLKPEESSEIELEEFVTIDENNDFEIFLAIDGIHCAACVWLIENILRKQQNVILARVNLSKKYLRLKWSGAKNDATKLLNLITGLGYKLFPFDEKILAREEKKYNNELVKSLAVAGFGAGNIMLFSIALWFYDVVEIGEKMREFLHFFSAIIAIPAIIYSARIFFKSGFLALKNRQSNMDIAISVAIILTCIVSFTQMFRGANHIYFDSAMMLCFFLLIGRYLDFKARKKAFDVASEFSFLNATYGRVVDDNGLIKIIASKDVKKDMILMVAAGEKIAADGVVIDGESEIDNSIISGESLPQKALIGVEVFAGATNISHAIKIKVTKNQENSLISDIKKIVESIENHKGKYVNLAQKISKFYTPCVHIIAILTFVFWYFGNNFGLENSLLNAIAVLIITCPCALALAVPIVQSLAISSLLKKGVILKSGDALEKINESDVFIFDKTGSLTNGRLDLISFKGVNFAMDKGDEEFYLKLAASICDQSLHPICRGISRAFLAKRFDVKTNEVKGFGLTANYENKAVKIGKSDFVSDEKFNENANCYLSFEGKIVAFYLRDDLKSDAVEVIKKLGKKVILLSGDRKNAVEKIARELGVEEFHFEKTPLQKIEIIEQLKAKNYKITAVGDGVNDAGLLALSDVSISFLSGANITQNVADIVISSDKLMPIIDLLDLSKRSILLIKQNFILALCYNLLAIPFAIFGFVTPLFAALAMSSSSILVTLNSLRILKK